MNRRSFIATGTATAFVPFLAGCTITPAEVAADGQAISNALIAVGAVYPAAQSQLDKAAASVVAATANWTTGSTTADINTALGVAEAVLGAIPQTQLVAQLLPIAVTAIDILLAAIPPPPATASNAVRAMAPNPYRNVGIGTEIPHVWGRSKANDLKAAWNHKAKAIGLPQAVIQ